MNVTIGLNSQRGQTTPNKTVRSIRKKVPGDFLRLQRVKEVYSSEPQSTCKLVPFKVTQD